MPTWAADRYSSIRSISLRASVAPREPSSASSSSARGARAHQREFGRHEEPVHDDQQDQQEEEEDGQAMGA